ncbi:MAG: RNA polymerase sigma factor [Draconibacterium sp.]
MADLRANIELKNGNPIAYKNLFRVLYPRMKSYCRLFVKTEDEVEDIIQETFIVLWNKRAKIRLDNSVESLVFVMLRNRCLNYLREANFKQQKINLEDISINELQYLYHLDFTGKEEKSLEELLIESFQKEVEALPEKMKQVFVRCKIEGIQQKQVAEELGISLKMVEKHIAAAKQRIRENLIKHHPELIFLIVLIFR